MWSSRAAVLVAALTLAAAAAGCAPGSDDELRSLVDSVLPERAATLECEWGSQWGTAAEAPESYYSCTTVAAGVVHDVLAPASAQLASAQFVLSCASDGLEGEVFAVRGELAVVVKVSAESHVLPGHVLLTVSAARFEEPQSLLREPQPCGPAL